MPFEPNSRWGDFSYKKQLTFWKGTLESKITFNGLYPEPLELAGLLDKTEGVGSAKKSKSPWDRDWAIFLRVGSHIHSRIFSVILQQ